MILIAHSYPEFKLKILFPFKLENDPKRGSRHTAHAAKALRWRVKQLLKCLIK